jgi:hypothetical protein
LEIRNGSDQVTRRFVWGTRYIDEAVAMYVNVNPGGTASWTRYLLEQDANYNVIRVFSDTNENAPAERYEYDPYGQGRIFRDAQLDVINAGHSRRSSHAARGTARGRAQSY